MWLHNRSVIDLPATERAGFASFEPGLDTFGSDDVATGQFGRRVLVPEIVYAVFFEADGAILVLGLGPKIRRLNAW